MSSSVSGCRCKGRRCLACCEDAMSFLVRTDDPFDYRKLLNECFVVVSDNAPPLSAFYPDCRWSQHEIVRRTIEMIMCEQPASSNVICSGYEKRSCSSPIIVLLTCSAWGLLLRRIGDDAMVYLLKYSSIFLPLSHKTHHQVAGFSISNLCLKSSKHVTASNHQHPLLNNGSKRKRKKVDEVDLISDQWQFISSSNLDVPLSSVCCFGCNDERSSTKFSKHCKKNWCQKNLSEEATFTSETGNANNDGHPNEKHLENSSQNIKIPKKHTRQFSWQRYRKRRQLNSQDKYAMIHCTEDINDKNYLSGRFQYGLSSGLSLHTEKMPSPCSCCMMLQTLQRVTEGAEINRKSMFYKLEYCFSVFPKKHILNSLKPNLLGANALFNDIFGLSVAKISADSLSCFHSGDCLINSTCIYHSLVKLLRILIRKARGCNHLRLLDKHCALPYLDQNTNGRAGTMFESNGSETNSIQGLAGVQPEGNLSLEKFRCSDSKICHNTPEMSDHHFDPSKSYCLKKQVVSFIWAACRSIVPPEMLGTPSNWRMLRKSVSRFVHLRRFEKFSVKQHIHKLKTSSFPFLSNKHSLCYLINHVESHKKGKSANVPGRFSELNDVIYDVKQKILENWICWFFSCLVMPMVQANFYVTECEHGKQDVFYFRKSIWKKLMSKAVTTLNEQSYCLLNDESLRKLISNRSFGFSRVRLCPKENGVRILANLRAASRITAKESPLRYQYCGLQGREPLHPEHVKYDHFRPVNGVLRGLHAVLKGLQMTEPEKLGSSVFDYNDVYRKLCPFLSGLKCGSTTIPEVFIVVADVSKAFDSINQDKLLSVMEDVVLNDKYHLKKTHQVVCTKKSLWIHQNIMSIDGTSAGSTKFSYSGPNHPLHSIVIDQEWSRVIKREELYFDLNEHLKHNVLQLDKKFYLQEVGIPQGSVLSSLLCSFYYGDLEKKVIFPFLERISESSSEHLSRRHSIHVSTATKGNEDETFSSSCKYILLRFIDDFLFLSTSKKQAAGFLSRLRRGFREYNCYMNEKKFGWNFNIDQISGLTSNRIYVGEDGVSFLRWSGMFINCCTLEIQADYTRYLDNHISSTLTVCWQYKPGLHLKAKLCDYLRPKCHPIFYDSNINSAAVVRLNVYQAFLICAMKFHCYIFDLTKICRIGSESYFVAIERSISFMYKLIKRRMHSMENFNLHPIFEVEEGEIEYLGLTAYIQVLKRKQSRHKELLSLLRSKVTVHGRAKSVSSVLLYAIDDSHSSLIWKIKY